MRSTLSHFINCWKKSFDFKGRSTRAEYWSFIILNVVLTLGLIAITSSINENFWIVAYAYFVAALAPYASSVVRRVRDTGMSLWLLILGLIPYIGQFFIFGLLLMPSRKKQ